MNDQFQYVKARIVIRSNTDDLISARCLDLCSITLRNLLEYAPLCDSQRGDVRVKTIQTHYDSQLALGAALVVVYPFLLTKIHLP